MNKTITYNTDTHQLMPKVLTKKMLEEVEKAVCLSDEEVYAALLAAAPQPPEQEAEPVYWVYTINKSHTIGSVEKPPEDAYDEGTLVALYDHTPDSAAEIARLQSENKDYVENILKLIATVKYMTGIGERGLGRTIKDDELPEKFLLAYVRSLENEIARLHKMLGELVADGQGRRPVCVNKPPNAEVNGGRLADRPSEAV